MTRCNTYLLVAAMAVSGMGMSVRAADDSAPFNAPSNTPTAVNNAGAQMQHVGGQMADESTAKSVRNSLAHIVNDGVEAKKFPTLTTYLAKADRDRMGDSKSMNQDDLNKTIDQFRQDFKAKYNQEFDISSDQLKNAMVYSGQDKNSATVSFARPSNASASMDSTDINRTRTSTVTGTPAAIETNNGTNGATADRTLNTTDTTVSNRSGDNSGAGLTSHSAGMRTDTASNGANSNSTVHGNDVTATPGAAVTNNNGMTNGNTGNVATETKTVNRTDSNLATANSAGMSALSLNLINEGHVMNAWRISSPQLSAEQLKQNLVKHIQMLDDQKAAWPSDVNAAYQTVAYHVLSAFNDNAMASDR